MNEVLSIIADDQNLIVYRKELNKLTGSVLSTILLQQLLFWSKKNKNKPFYKFIEPCNHSLYKEGDSWCEELGFTKYEFSSAYKKLNVLGIVSKKTNRERVTFYVVDTSNLAKLIKPIYQSEDNQLTKADKTDLDNSKSLTTETTTETTTDIKEQKKELVAEIIEESIPLKNTAASEQEQLLFNFLYTDEAIETFNRYKITRKKLKCETDDFIIKRLLKKLIEFKQRGHDPIDVISNAITSNWKDFFEPKNFGISFKEQEKKVTSDRVEAISRGFDPYDPKNYANQESGFVDPYDAIGGTNV